jgi:hypothetical protein
MAAHALELGVTFPTVKDPDLSIARLLGVARTPGVVLIDRAGKLVFRGRFDDALQRGGVRSTGSRGGVREALAAVLAGREPEFAETPVDGCLISAIPATDATSAEALPYR